MRVLIVFLNYMRWAHARRHFLAVGACLKNEAFAITEWLTHYQHEGATAFLLLDDHSSDGTVAIAQQFFQTQPQVQGLFIMRNKTKHRYVQRQLYQQLGGFIVDAGLHIDWLLMVDADEFAYCRSAHMPIRQMLMNERYTRVDLVYLPWLVFGASGHEHQPASIVDAFRRRANYDGNVTWNAGPKHHDISRTSWKYIVRPDAVRTFACHECSLKPQKKAAWSMRACPRKMSERIIDKFDIVINHYQVQSREFWITKTTRGDALGNNIGIKRRQLSWFDEHNRHCNEVYDDALACSKNNSSCSTPRLRSEDRDDKMVLGDG